jgi:hypothetical protein
MARSSQLVASCDRAAAIVEQASSMAWERGQEIVARQIWHGRPVFGIPLIVIEDTAEHLVTYTAPGAPFGFTDAPFPTPDGLHPRRHGGSEWVGHGVVEVTRWDSDYSVMHFWRGSNRTFAAWYLNIQEPLRRTSIGYDTQDLELDVVIYPNGRWDLKDDELLDVWVARGRWTAEDAAGIRATGRQIVDEVVERGDRWWGQDWSGWVPDARWAVPSLPPEWADLPTSTAP